MRNKYLVLVDSRWNWSKEDWKGYFQKYYADDNKVKDVQTLWMAALFVLLKSDTVSIGDSIDLCMFDVTNREELISALTELFTTYQVLTPLADGVDVSYRKLWRWMNKNRIATYFDAVKLGIKMYKYFSLAGKQAKKDLKEMDEKINNMDQRIKDLEEKEDMELI